MKLYFDANDLTADNRKKAVFLVAEGEIATTLLDLWQLYSLGRS